MQPGGIQTGYNLSHCVQQALYTRGHDTALIFADLYLGAQSLLGQVQSMRLRLEKAGICAGNTIGICLERSPDTVILLLALWDMEATYVPLDPGQPSARIESMLNTAGCDFVVMRPDAGVCHPSDNCQVLLLPPLDYSTELPTSSPMVGPPVHPVAHSSPAADTLVLPSRCAYIMFTSGSSGKPKGVRISQHSLRSLLHAIYTRLDLKGGERILGCSNFSFDISLFELLMPLLMGGTLVLLGEHECRDPQAIVKALQVHEVNVIQATPSLWTLLLAAGLPDIAGKLAISTGEALSRPLAKDLLSRTEKLWNLYGPTESTLWCSAHQVNHQDTQPDQPDIISIGRPLAGYHLHLHRSSNGNLPEGAGELWISGNGLALGYANDENLSNQKFTITDNTRFYHSGDLCRADSCENFHYLGRLDGQFKFNGYRIEPQEIESALENHPCIKAACIGLYHNRNGNSQLMACVVHEHNLPNKTSASLNRYLQLKLPDYMLPQRYAFVASIPLTSSGKKDRTLMMQNMEEQQEHSNGKPSGKACDRQAGVAGIFCEILNIDHIEPCDSFFDQGGNSMLAATLLMTINHQYCCEISLRELLAQPPTVQRVEKLISQ